MTSSNGYRDGDVPVTCSARLKMEERQFLNSFGT